MNGARFKGLLYFHGLCFKIAGLCACFSLTPVITWDFSNSAPPVWEGILVNCQDATRTRFLLVLSSSTNPDNSFTHQQMLLLLPSSQKSWMVFVGVLLFPAPENAKLLALLLGQSIQSSSSWVDAQLLPHSTGWFVFPPFLFSEYRCCCLYFRYWYIIDQSIENAQITLELRFYGTQKLTVVRSWLVSILISRHLGSFHWHHLKMLPVPSM